MTCTSFVSFRTQKALRGFFGKLGILIYYHPLIFISVGIVITILCGAGVLFQEFESRSLYLWIPRDSKVWKEYQQSIDYFGQPEAYLYLLIKHKNGDNLLTPKYLNISFEIYQQAMDTDQVSVVYEGETFGFNDLCEKKYPSYPTCSTLESNNVFFLFGNTPAMWQNQEAIESRIMSFPAIATVYVGGNLVYDDDTDEVIGGSHLKCIYTLEGTKNETLIDAGIEFMTAFTDYWQEHDQDYEDDDLEIYYITQNSISTENQKVVSNDIPIFIVAMIIMLVYISLTLGRKLLSCIEPRIWLALSSIFIMMMAMIVSVGLGSIMQFNTNILVALIPFILLGIGVDDQIIIVETLNTIPYPKYNTEWANNSQDDVADDKDLEAERLSVALQHSGLSISLTSFASVIAFTIGSFIDIPAIESFCVFAALAFLANYILQFFLFVPLLSMDERRIMQNRNFCCCCIQHTDPPTTSPGIEIHDITLAGAKVAPSRSIDPEFSPPPSSDGGTNATSTSTTEKENDHDEYCSKCETIVSHFSVGALISNTIVPLQQKRLFRLILIGLFIIVTVISGFSLQWLNSASDTSKFVSDNSYVITWNKENRAGFGKVAFTPTSIILEDIDFSDENVRKNITTFVANVEEYNTSNGYTIGNVNTWYFDFIDETQALLTNETNGEITIADLSQTEFYEYLQIFANDTQYAEWNDFIVYEYDDDDDDDSSENYIVTGIEATKWFIFTNKATRLGDIWPFKTGMDRVMENDLGTKDGFFLDDYFPWAYLESVIVELTITNMVFALIGVVIVMMFLMDLKMSSFIAIVVVMIDIDLFGWMVLFDVSLDSVSYVELVMAVGLTVDYVIHIAHAIVAAHPVDDSNYNERVRIALTDMGVGVTKGAMTTMLGVIMLAFSQSEVFRVFFVMFCGIVVIAFLHGFLFVPAIMGEIPWLYKGVEEPTDDNTLGRFYSVERTQSKHAHLRDLNLDDLQYVNSTRI